jgi:dihydrofolate reductase
MTAPEPDAAGTPRQRIVLVAAVADNGVIGHAGEIPWRIPEDMRHFREVTTGHPVLMGRVTYESIGRPLPGRTNIVVTRDRAWSADGVRVVRTVQEGLDLAREVGGDVMVIGGAQIYEATMGAADVQVLTEVHQSPDGDTFYPPFDRSDWAETRRESCDGYDWVWLERRRSV